MDELYATPRVLKVIDTVVGSEERRRSVLRAAIESSGHPTIPEKLEDLLVFVRAHLLPALSAQIGPRLATVVLADIDLAIQKEFRKRARQNGPASSHRDERTVEDGPPPSSNTIVDRDDVLAQTSRSGIPSSGRKVRYAVLVVDRDRVGASMLARSIIHSGCDVAVADAATIDTALTGGFEPDVLILGERDAMDMSPALRALLTSRPHLALLVRVVDHGRLAESILQSITASRKCATITCTAPTLEVVAVARQLCAETYAVAAS